MARRLFVRGLVTAACLFVAGLGSAYGQDVARKPAPPGGGVTFTTGLAGGEAIFVAERPGVRFEKRTDGRTAQLRIVAGRDQVRVHVDRRQARVSRGGREVQVTINTLAPDQFRRVATLLRGSQALRGLEAMAVTSVENRHSGSIALRTALALVRTLSGDMGAARQASASLSPAAPAFAVVRAMARDEEVIGDCYDEYQRAAYRYVIDLEACIDETKWIPLGAYACTWEWSLKIEVAWFQLILCAGGLPAV